MMIMADQDYALRALVCMAEAGRRLSSLELARATKASRDYLIQVFQPLRNVGILDAMPGKSGGYALASDPASISVLDVFDALREPQSWEPEAWPSARVSAAVRAALGEITAKSLAMSLFDGEKEG